MTGCWESTRQSGKVQFQRPWRARQAASVNAATPLVVDDLIFVSAEYGPGAGVLRLNGSTLVDLWTSDDVLSNHYATSVHHDGHLYGFHGRQEFGPSFRAVELRTGVGQVEPGSVPRRQRPARRRSTAHHARGRRARACARFAAGFQPIARAQILQGVVGPYPAIADGFLYVRNDNTLVCVDLRNESPSLASAVALVARRLMLASRCCDRVRARCSIARSMISSRTRRGIGGRFRSRRGAGARCRAATVAARHRAVLCRAATTTAASSSSRIALSIPTTSRTRRGISSASRVPSRRRRRARRCCRSGPISARRCAKIYQMFRGR